MGFTRTSRTLLRDRSVRVDRRARLDDGAYGTVAAFSTIISRYWCGIFPTHHRERRRLDPGETPVGAGPTHLAIADPSRNGISIMVGDRFIDERNNQTYDVLAVQRVRGGPYSRTHRIVLRIVSDAREEVAS